ncbi:hypothetical protein [Aurantibacter sp.]|uniref:hypothetical protein n=1 Tax=Aurantibacter sp. TaxID=2807103 RepID=UPI0032665B7F
MNLLKNSIKKNFTIVPNELINNTYLSDRARFLFVFLACKPDSWDFYNKNLASSLGYSIESLRKYMRDLIDSGWIIKIKQSRKNGKFAGNNYLLQPEALQISPRWKKHVTEIIRLRENLAQSNTKYHKKRDLNNTDFFLNNNPSSNDMDVNNKSDRGPLK